MLGLRLLPSGVHYGWWIAAAIAVVMFATVGVGFYGLAVFLRPLQEENGWSNSAVSGATGMYFSVTGLTGFAIGPLIDRNGPIRYMTIGVTLVGLSVILLSLVDELWQLYAVYLVQAIAFGLAGSVAVSSIMARWFITKRAKALSISSTGVSLGGVVLSPLGTWLVGEGGVALAAVVMGVLVLVVGLPIVSTVLVWDPADVGLEPDGGSPDLGVQSTALSDEVQLRVWTRSQAARTRAFWAILISFVLVLLAQTGFLLHQIAFLTDRLASANAAALALSVTAMGSIVARLALGQIADRLDKKLLAAGLFLVQGAAVLGLLGIDDRIVTYVLVLVIGFTIGNVYLMQTLLVAETFGLVSMGTVFGVVSLAAQVGSGLGPFAIGWIEDQTGSYSLAFAIGAALTLAAAVIVLFADTPERQQPAKVVSPDGSRASG
jgi:sugar phosphate permease